MGLGTRLFMSANLAAPPTTQIAAYLAPDGVLSTEMNKDDEYVPEVILSKNVRKPRGRMADDRKSFGAPASDDDEPVAAPVLKVSTR